ncbi:hypothetical protein B9Z55_006630 [Caenorhabditis nigoni]|uniref:Arrestin C-terminal-like domain-containing protein n=1 Tax=Caenorhabditis nigoni TaxID=1611254 RepID=A0A2G5V5Y1_9PELO|nr:hypothetical protein B9Z55_006630 [Caenorhabditis nigoni]
MAWCDPQIEFEKDLYFPGEQVNGRAWVSTTGDQTARNVELTFIGKALTAWKNRGKRSEEAVANNLYKRSEETFFEIKNVVWTPENDKNVFPAGDYEWKFSFDLPKECPTSFEGTFGFIRYFVRVHIDVPHWLDTKVERAFSVSSTVDLNSIPGARDPVEVKVERMNNKLGCFPFLGNHGKVIYTVSIIQIRSNKVGCVSGEKIIVTGTIENQSSKTLGPIRQTFLCKTKYRDETSETSIIANLSNCKTVDRVLGEMTKEVEIAPGATETFKISFEIPPVVSTIRSSKCISVEYFFTVTASRQWFDTSDPPALNLIFGNVPFLKKGVTELPPHTFVEKHAAQCWNNHIKPEFRYKVPYYGTVKNSSDN